MRTAENERQTLRVGAAVIVGAEVRLAAGVTLGGAYTFGLRYLDTDDTVRLSTDGEADERTREQQSLSAGTGTSGLSLSVYF